MEPYLWRYILEMSLFTGGAIFTGSRIYWWRYILQMAQYGAILTDEAVFTYDAIFYRWSRIYWWRFILQVEWFLLIALYFRDGFVFIGSAIFNRWRIFTDVCIFYRWRFTTVSYYQISKILPYFTGGAYFTDGAY